MDTHLGDEPVLVLPVAHDGLPHDGQAREDDLRLCHVAAGLRAQPRQYERNATFPPERRLIVRVAWGVDAGRAAQQRETRRGGAMQAVAWRRTDTRTKRTGDVPAQMLPSAANAASRDVTGVTPEGMVSTMVISIPAVARERSSRPTASSWSPRPQTGRPPRGQKRLPWCQGPQRTTATRW